MKNILFFITHATLDINHAEAVFKSISKQSIEYQLFDTMYLYNTHQHELSNDSLVKLFEKYNLYKFIKELKIFDYQQNLPKKLTHDLAAIISFSLRQHENDRILILKSDTVVSKNYFKELSSLDTETPKVVIAPYVCAKKRVSIDNTLKYCERETFIESDDITFFTEDENGNSNSDFNRRPEISIESEQIQFFSCRAVRFGFTSVYADCKLLQKIRLEDTDWGGTDFSDLMPFYVRFEDSFIVHMYHDIISENRKTDREGPVTNWLRS